MPDGGTSTYFVGPEGESHVDRKGAWRQFNRAQGSPMDMATADVQALLECWDRLVAGRVDACESVGRWRVGYTVRSNGVAGDAYAAPPAGQGGRIRSRRVLADMMAGSEGDSAVSGGGVDSSAASSSSARVKRAWTVEWVESDPHRCGTPGCTVWCSKNHEHAGPHVFEEPAPRRGGAAP